LQWHHDPQSKKSADRTFLKEKINVPEKQIFFYYFFFFYNLFFTAAAAAAAAEEQLQKRRWVGVRAKQQVSNSGTWLFEWVRNFWALSVKECEGSLGVRADLYTIRLEFSVMFLGGVMRETAMSRGSLMSHV
jgi:hypothetical protein